MGSVWGQAGTRDGDERDLELQEWGQRSGDGDGSWEWSGDGAGGTRDGDQGVGTGTRDTCRGTGTLMALLVGLGNPSVPQFPPVKELFQPLF